MPMQYYAKVALIAIVAVIVAKRVPVIRDWM